MLFPPSHGRPPREALNEKQPGAKIIRSDDENKSCSEIRTEIEGQFPRLWRYCLTLTGRRDTADDLAQRTCLRALERSHLLTPGTSPRAWLFTIARRLWLNDLRSAAVRRGTGTIDATEADLVADDRTAEMNIYVGEVLAAIGTLPVAQREVVMLVYVEGLRYREAAEVMDIPVGTVMSRLANARSRLAKDLGCADAYV